MPLIALNRSTCQLRIQISKVGNDKIIHQIYNQNSINTYVYIYICNIYTSLSWPIFVVVYHTYCSHVVMSEISTPSCHKEQHSQHFKRTSQGDSLPILMFIDKICLCFSELERPRTKKTKITCILLPSSFRN